MKKVKEKPVKVVVVRSKWLRGTGDGELRQAAGKHLMCCLGFVGKTCGVRGITGLNAPHDIPSKKWPLGLFRDDAYDRLSDVCHDLITANDDDDARAEKKREAKIQKLGRKAGIEFSFVD